MKIQSINTVGNYFNVYYKNSIQEEPVNNGAEVETKELSNAYYIPFKGNTRFAKEQVADYLCKEANFDTFEKKAMKIIELTNPVTSGAIISVIEKMKRDSEIGFVLFNDLEFIAEGLNSYNSPIYKEIFENSGDASNYQRTYFLFDPILKAIDTKAKADYWNKLTQTPILVGSLELFRDNGILKMKNGDKSELPIDCQFEPNEIIERLSNI